MKQYLLIIGLLLLVLGCQPQSEEVDGTQIESENAIQSNQSEIASYPEPDGPSVTAEIQFQPAPERAEDYPEPEIQVVESLDQGYPEPESEGVANEAEGSAAVVADTFVPEGMLGEGDVQVVFVKAQQTAPETWTFNVTLEHEDTGWEDYADGWDVVLPDGVVIKPQTDSPFTRLLLHPHENEQPFTRSQSGIVIPAEVDVVFVRAHETVEGYGADFVAVNLNEAGGDRFEVIR